MVGEEQFSKGMEVEVCSDDKGLRGAWFVATVLRSIPRRSKVSVEYQTLLAEEGNDSKLLRELVPVVNLRPIPPRELNRRFNFSDEVDAFHNDGWWEGVVTRVLGEEENSRYLVYFRTGKEEVEFSAADLRIHREWVGGSWVPPMEEEAEELPQPAINEVYLVGVDEVMSMEERKISLLRYQVLDDVKQDTGTKHNGAEVRNDQVQVSLVQSTASIANALDNMDQEIERSSTKSNISSVSPPSKKLKKEEAIESPFLLRTCHGKALPTNPTLEGEETHLRGDNEINQNLTDIVSSPSEQPSDHLAPDFTQEKVDGVLECENSLNNASVDYFSLSSLTTRTPTEEGISVEKKEINPSLNNNFSSPSEGPSDHLVSNIGQEKNGSVLDRGRFGTNPIVDGFSVSVRTISNMEEENLLGKKKELTQNLTDSIPLASEGLHDNLPLNFGQEKSGSVLRCDRAESDTLINDRSLSTLIAPNTEGEVSLVEKSKEYQSMSDIITSPSTEKSDPLAPDFGKEKIGSGSSCNRSDSHPATGDFISLPSNNEGEHYLSTAPLQCSQTSLVAASSPLDAKVPEKQQCVRHGKKWRCPAMALQGKQHCEKHLLEQSTRSRKRRKSPTEECRLVLKPFIPSDDPQQCRRNGKGWRCSEKAPPRERYCEKHLLEQNTRNEKRRKRPIEECLFFMKPFIPSDVPQQCRRNGKGWRCSAKAPPRERYCEKHQLEQKMHNEKRRKRTIEQSCSVTSGTEELSNSNRDDLLLSDKQHYGSKDEGTKYNGDHLSQSDEQQSDRVDNGTKPSADHVSQSDEQQCGIKDRGSEEQSNSNGDHLLQSDAQQCGRKGKGKKCTQSCAIEKFIPSDDPQQCRRVTKGWRCPDMAPPRKRYCDKHQLEQNKNNEKRRKRVMERCEEKNQNAIGVLVVGDTNTKASEDESRKNDEGNALEVGDGVVSKEGRKESEGFFDEFWFVNVAPV